MSNTIWIKYQDVLLQTVNVLHYLSRHASLAILTHSPKKMCCIDWFGMQGCSVSRMRVSVSHA